MSLYYTLGTVLKKKLYEKSRIPIRLKKGMYTNQKGEEAHN